jgi:hypothetical protein
MGPVNWLVVILATLAFFAVGALWYGVLFRAAWQREARIGDPPQGAAAVRIMLGTLLCEFVVVAMLGHLFARTDPSDRAMWMIAIGFGAMIMAPTIGINYLHQRRSLKLFLIDAGHCVAGMAAVCAVFVVLG